MLRNQHMRWQLAACYRATYLGLTVMSGSEILEVRRHRILDRGHRHTHLEELLRQLADDYAITDVVVEPDSVVYADADKPNSRSRKATCPCGFIIRVAKKTLEATVIRCDTCGEPFCLV